MLKLKVQTCDTVWDLSRNVYGHRSLTQMLKLPFHYLQTASDTRFLRDLTDTVQEFVLETAVYFI